MIEVGLSPAETTLPSSLTVGVWLFVLTPKNKLFIVENLKAKYVSQKVPGQWNAPAETLKIEDVIDRNGKKMFSFKEATIPRAIREEIGSLDFDLSQIKDLGLINFQGLGERVVASPFLIPIQSEDCLSYSPQDHENGDKKWIDIEKITENPQVLINGESVPLFRSPMVEITRNAIAAIKGKPFKTITHVNQTVSQKLVTQFTH